MGLKQRRLSHACPVVCQPLALSWPGLWFAAVLALFCRKRNWRRSAVAWFTTSMRACRPCHFGARASRTPPSNSHDRFQRSPTGANPHSASVGDQPVSEVPLPSVWGDAAKHATRDPFRRVKEPRPHRLAELRWPRAPAPISRGQRTLSSVASGGLSRTPYCAFDGLYQDCRRLAECRGALEQNG